MDPNKLHSLLIRPATTLKNAMQKLSETGERILFVTNDDKKLLGTVTDGDIRGGIIQGVPLSVSVESIMASTFLSVEAHDPGFRRKGKALMQQYKIEQIPVLAQDGTILDVLLWLDFLASEAELNGHEAREPLHIPVVVMAGGKGSRLEPFTKILPKPLIPVGNKPIIEHIMDRFHQYGVQRFLVIVNYKKEMIKSYFAENGSPYSIDFIEEEQYYGTAGGLGLLKGVLEETFVVTNCDTLLEGNYRDVLDWHNNHHNFLTIVGAHKEIVLPYGVLDMQNSAFMGIREKPKFDLFINSGTYFCQPEVLAMIREQEHLDMDKLLDRIKTLHQDKIGVYPHWDGWCDIGQWDEYRETVKKLGDM